MNREETKNIIKVLTVAYPNYHPENITHTVDIWATMLEEYDAKEVMIALKTFIATDRSGFAPSIGQIIGRLNDNRKIATDDDISELSTWQMVYKAICNSNYNSVSEFEKLPATIQKVIGSPKQLEEWARMDIDTIQSVEQSHFFRNYRTVLQREKEIAEIPESIRNLLMNVAKTEQLENKDLKRLKVK